MQKLWESGLPAILKQYGVFCLNRNKVPYKADGTMAHCDDIKDFVSYQQAKSILDKGGFDGISIGLFSTKSGLNLCCIDIDHCVNKDTQEIQQDVFNIVNKLKTYTEISPSGTGLHIFFRTKQVWDKEKYYTNKREIVNPDTGEIIKFNDEPIGFEIYNSGITNKVIRLSENAVLNYDLKDLTNIDWFLNTYMVKTAIEIVPDEFTPHFSKDIESYINNDKKLEKLFYKTEHDDNIGDSQIDMSLCCKLAFYLNKDEKLINSYFMMSDWYTSKDQRHKDKWEKRKDYRENTIKKACSIVHYKKSVATNNNDTGMRSYTYDDTGNAKRLIDSFGIDIRWNVENKQWMIWNGNYWQTDVMNKVRGYVDKMVTLMENESLDLYNELNQINEEEEPKLYKETTNKYKQILKNIAYLRSKRGKDNCLYEAQSIGETPVSNSIFDTHTNLLCTKKGTYDLKTGEVFENNRLDYFTKYIDIEPDFNNKPKEFDKFLKNILKKHIEILDYVHRLFGYTLTAETKEQKIFFLYGDGNDGKSVLLDTISKAMGEYATSAKKDLIMDVSQATQNENSLARIKGKRLVWIDEIGSRDKLNEGLVKNATSGTGEISARFLYANEFTYKFTSKVIATTNYEPRITGTDKGIWRRIIVLPFDLNLNENEIDKDLIFKLEKELPQILAWLINGAKEYYKRGLNDTPQCALNMISEYKEESDVVQQWLNEKTVAINDDQPSTASELYENYLVWCKKENQPQLSQTIWGKSMRKKFKKARINHTTVYFGVGLLDEKVFDRKTILKARAMAEHINTEDI